MSSRISDGNDDEIEMMKTKAMHEIQKNARARQTQDDALKALDGKAITLTDSDFSSTVGKYPLVLVDFWAPWCAPCRMISPVVDQLAQEYSGKVAFGRVNVDENQRTASQFRVQGIPTLMLFKNGRAVDQLVGAYPKNIIDSRIRLHLGSGSPVGAYQ